MTENPNPIGVNIPHNFTTMTLLQPFVTATGTGQITVCAAGAHPNVRLKKFWCITISATVQCSAVVELAAGTDLTDALNSGTAIAFVTGALKAGYIDDNPVPEIPYNQGIIINVTAAGTDAIVLYVIELATRAV